MPFEADKPIPVLPHGSYKGVPEEFVPDAQQVKSLFLSNRTHSGIHDRGKEELPVLPPDITREAFNAAIEDLRRILGPENVELNDKPLDDGWYVENPNTHDSFACIDPNYFVSSAAVYPSSTEEVVQVVKWANRTLIPLNAISLGRNFTYGGAAPRLRGCVTVDLGRRMNKVLKIDPVNASCLVEPGVSYFQLYEEVKASNTGMWIDPPDLGGGSVMGNALERGFGYSPMSDHWGNHCGMEVVLANGEVVRTGMGALPGPNGEDNPSWQSFQHAFGPSVDGIFSQGNYGIVTKIGFWLMPETNAVSYMVTFPRDDDFEQIIEIIRPLALRRVFGNVPQLRHTTVDLASTGNPRSHYWKGDGQMPREEIAKWSKTLPSGECAWIFYGTLYGPEAKRDGPTVKLLQSEFAKVRGSKWFWEDELPKDYYNQSRAEVAAGVPQMKELQWVNWMPNGAHVDFAPIVPVDPKNARTVRNIVSRLHKKYGFDLMPAWIITGREIHFIALIIYDRTNEKQKAAATSLFGEMIAECAKEGFGEYRAHPRFHDQVAGTYNWNDGALLKMTELIKDSLDPNSIMAPGKNGIWGKRWRGRGFELWRPAGAVDNKYRL